MVDETKGHAEDREICRWPECDWRDWSRHILAELRRLSGEVQEINRRLSGDVRQVNETIDEMRESMSESSKCLEGRLGRLEVKAGVWGGLAGLLSALAALIVMHIKGDK